MSYSYSSPAAYGAQDMSAYENMYSQTKSGAAAAGCIGAVVGAGAGTFIGIRKNPYMKKDLPTDTFTNRTFKKFLKNMPEVDQKTYKQLKEISKKISKISTVDELKTLLNNNPEGAKEVFNVLGKDSASFLQNVNESGLNATKEVIKDKIASSNNMLHQDLKNKIIKLWNPEKKKFEANENAAKNVFDAINSAKKGMKLKQALKFAAIGAAVCGVLGAVLQKIISHKKDA